MNKVTKLLSKLGKALGISDTSNRPIPKHSIGSSKMSNKNRKPNLYRRMRKPVYGGMAHRLDPIGQTPAPSIDKIRTVEMITGCKLMVKWDGLHIRVSPEADFQYLGNTSDSVKELVGKYLKIVDQVFIKLCATDLNVALAEKHGILFEEQQIPKFRPVDYKPEDFANPAVEDYEAWYNRHYDALQAEFYENGMDGELDSDLEEFVENRYETYIRSIQTV